MTHKKRGEKIRGELSRWKIFKANRSKVGI